jgi:XapX domain-containing protein
VKATIGLVLAFALGFSCRAFGIPSPAPPVVVGALLVMAMTTGYVLVDRYAAARPARHKADCGGPSGLAPSALHREGGAAGGTRPFPRDRGRDAAFGDPRRT